MTLDLVWNGARWVFSIALVPDYGAAAVAMGMLLALALHLGWILLTIRLRYQLKVGWKHSVRFLTGLAIVGLVAEVGATGTSSVPAMITAAAIWIIYAAYVARSTSALATLRSVLPRR